MVGNTQWKGVWNHQVRELNSVYYIAMIYKLWGLWGIILSHHNPEHLKVKAYHCKNEAEKEICFKCTPNYC